MLLRICHRIESAADRVRDERWGPRTLDVDVLWVEGVTSDEPVLTVPHPRWKERRFVLAPAAGPRARVGESLRPRDGRRSGLAGRAARVSASVRVVGRGRAGGAFAEGVGRRGLGGRPGPGTRRRSCRRRGPTWCCCACPTPPSPRSPGPSDRARRSSLTRRGPSVSTSWRPTTASVAVHPLVALPSPEVGAARLAGRRDVRGGRGSDRPRARHGTRWDGRRRRRRRAGARTTRRP